MKTLSPGTTNIPRVVTVQLRYTLGPVERIQEVSPGFNGVMSLEGGSQLNGIGQNGRGQAFVAIAVDSESMRSRQFVVTAQTLEHGELKYEGFSRDGNSERFSVMSFNFGVPLSQVVKFHIGTRPIRTNVWKNVILPAH
ncbi:MAG TPA: hypothetical protein VFW05_02645 [Verrucomicrobiae bacterium]|nr:hypothetical protein [Verrucomicrobiae bacterium]